MSDLPINLTRDEEWNQIFLLYDSAIKEISTKLEILNNEFKLSHQYNPIEHIETRLKSIDSIARKLRRKGKELTIANVMKYVNDVAGVRIICSFTSDIYRIAKAISGQSDIEILKIKDYIKNPKANGYMSYHMIITIPIFLSDRSVRTKLEIQIRTIAMDFWASLEHKIYYKFEGNAPHGIQSELKECADVVAYLDKKMLLINESVKEFAEKDSVQNEYIDDVDSSVVDLQHISYIIDEENGADNVGKEKKKKRWKAGGKQDERRKGTYNG